MVELAAPELPPISGAVKGTVAIAPTALGKPFQVVVPTFSADHAYEIRRWQSRGLTVPAVGDEVLIVEDEIGLPWVVAWWPAAGDVSLSQLPTAWVAPTLLNSWANFETSGTNMTLAYRKGQDGRVTVRGLIKHEASLTGLAASQVFTLPEGFRPSKGLIFPSVEGTAGTLALATISVGSAGEVNCVPGATGAVTYTPMNFSFYAD